MELEKNSGKLSRKLGEGTSRELQSARLRNGKGMLHKNGLIIASDSPAYPWRNY